MFIDCDINELIRTRTLSAQLDGLALEYPEMVAEESVMLSGSPTMKRAASVLSNRWELCLENAIQAIVSLRITEFVSFDTSSRGVYNASGFVVDAENGIILTNRHVLSSGPFSAVATFNNYEEVDAEVLYIDPVHDFGFLRFQPSAVRYMKVVELELRPESAKIGTDIRVVGNDRGEHLSIQHGIISRLDREAPPYGMGNYNDINTFYLQACSGTSVGSSGSPVLNCKGKVVALNAGAATNGNQSFYFPLQRVQRSLDLIRSGLQVSRGCLMCDFVFTTFDQARRLSLTDEVEAMYRKKNGQRGVFVVDHIIKGGVSDGHLERSDILISLNGYLISDFVALETILDDQVGSIVELHVLREGLLKHVSLEVACLQELACPDVFVEIGDAVVHQVTYHQARSFGIPIADCFVSQAGAFFGQAGIQSKFLLLSVNNVEVPNIRALIKYFREGQFGNVLQFHYRYPHCQNTHVGLVNLSMLGEVQVFTKDSQWTPETIKLTKVVEHVTQTGQNFVQIQTGNGAINDAARSVVHISSHLSLMVDGQSQVLFEGVGIILDAVKGIIATVSQVVPSYLSQVQVTFSNSYSTNANVLFIHPQINLVLLEYQPQHVDRYNLLRNAVLDSSVPKESNTETCLVALKSGGSRMFRHTRVQAVEQSVDNANVEHLILQDVFQDSIGGVMFSHHGQVQGLWCGTEGYALPSIYLAHCLQQVSTGQTLQLLPATVRPIPLAIVKQLGLSNVWMDRLTKASLERHTVLQVIQGSASLKDGDVILHVNGYLLTRCMDLELLQFSLSQNCLSDLDVLVLRNGQEIAVKAETKQVSSSFSPQYYIHWNGCVIQKPMKSELELPFISNVMVGSPAQAAGLAAGYFIQSIGSVQMTLNLKQDCMQLPKDLSVKVVLQATTGCKKIVAIKQNPIFWPGYLLRVSKDGIERFPI